MPLGPSSVSQAKATKLNRLPPSSSSQAEARKLHRQIVHNLPKTGQADGELASSGQLLGVTSGLQPEIELHWLVAPSMTADGQVKLKSAFSTTDKEMDNKLATVKQSLDDSIDEAKKDGSLTWQVVESIFLTEEGLKEDGDQVYRCKSFTTESTTGDVSDGRMRIQVEAWFKSLISDEDVIRCLEKSTRLQQVTGVVAGKGRASGLTGFIRGGFREKSFLDVGMIRFPYPSDPYLRVFRLHLTAWAQSKPCSFGHANGVVGGEYTYKSPEYSN